MDFKEFSKRKEYSEASGSMAVADYNIAMHMNDFGLYEEVLLDPSSDVKKEALFVSPNFNSEINETNIANELYKDQEGIKFDQRLGYYDSLYVGHVNEGEYRQKASSGGIGTWIFKELFDNDMIDYVIHVKKNDNFNYDNIMFKYDISSTIEEIKNGAKTKYYPVEISEVMEKVKSTPGRYAIIGIPSFIYSIRLLAKQDEIINERIKFTVGLICGHQKSTKFAESMAFQVGIKPGDLLDIDFRHKLPDSPANRYAVKMTGIVDGEEKTIIKPTSELYGQNWGWGFFKPTASDYTDDVFNETADIVIGDAWLPEYTTDSKGNNIVIVRNKKIANLMKDAILDQRLKMDSVDNETIFLSQSSHYRHTHDELAYRLSVKEAENEWHPDKRVEASSNISQMRKDIQDLRRIISKQSHFQYKEALRHNEFSHFIKQMDKYTIKYTKLYRKLNRKKRVQKLLKMNRKEFVNKVFKRLSR